MQVTFHTTDYDAVPVGHHCRLAELINLVSQWATEYGGIEVSRDLSFTGKNHTVTFKFANEHRGTVFISVVTFLFLDWSFVIADKK